MEDAITYRGHRIFRTHHPNPRGNRPYEYRIEGDPRKRTHESLEAAKLACKGWPPPRSHGDPDRTMWPHEEIPTDMLRPYVAARYARVTRKTIRQWVKQGHLSHHEAPDGTLRIDGAELGVYLSQRKREPKRERWATPKRKPIEVDPFVPAIQVRRSERIRWQAASRDLGMSGRAAFLEALEALEQRARAARAAV